MTFPLKRLNYLRSKRFLKELLVYLIFLALAVVLRWMENKELSLIELLPFLPISAILLGTRLLFLPKSFTVKGRTVRTVTYFKGSRYGGGFSIRIGSSSPRRRVHVVMKEIWRIEYLQKPGDIPHRTGTLRLYGTILVSTKSGAIVENVTIPEYLTLYGVKDFSKALSALQTEFPEAECEKKEE